MDRVYDFSWMADEIDNSIILMLIKKDMVVSTYQISYLLTGDMRQMEVKFANIEDLEDFALYGIVRFYDVTNKDNIIDIPIGKLKEIYENCNKFDSDKAKKKIKLSDLDCFSVINDKTNNEDYSVEVISFGDISDSFKKVIDRCNRYGKMNMMEKFDALCDINLVNYRVESNSAYV